MKYWPEPIGYRYVFANQTDKDPYTPAYMDLHARDLPIVRYELGANALLLGAWGLEDVSHYGFVHESQRHSLSVIPAFDIGWYYQDGNWNNQGTRMSLAENFKRFLENSADRTSDMKPYTPDEILMWNLVGLPNIELLLPRSCVTGAAADVSNFRTCISDNPDLADAVATMSELQEILDIIRLQQKRFFCTEGPSRPVACDVPDDVPGAFTFDRPLAITVELGADFALAFSGNQEYLRGVIFWMERVLGCRKVQAGQVEISLSANATQAYCRFNGHGFFDAWVFKVLSATSKSEADNVQQLIRVFSRPRFVPDGTFPTTLDDVSGAMKPVILEYGFSALTSDGSLNATKQHQLVQQVWEGFAGDNMAAMPNIKTATDNGFCVLGGAIDEWTDVWSAPEEYYECDVEVSSDFRHSTCGPVTDGGKVSVGYMGLTGQFDTLMMHCLDERVDEAERFHFLDGFELQTLQQSIGYAKPRLCGIVLLRPGLHFVVWCVAAVAVLLLMCFGCCRECRSSCRSCRRPAMQGESNSDHNLALACQTEASKRKLEEIDSTPYGKTLAQMVANALGDDDLHAEVPVRYSQLVGYSGWGLAKVNDKFSYHRLQYNGLGRGATVQEWETEQQFIKWLQDQSDRSMAVYGFSEEELRRTDLIGNKTVTSQQMLEMLEAKGKFGEIESVAGLGQARVDLFGQPLDFWVRLKYRACPAFLNSVIQDGPRLERYEEGAVATWQRDVADHTQKWLEVMATTHLQVQGDRLKRQAEHEAEAMLADVERKNASEGADQPRARNATRWRIPTTEEDAAFKRACYNIWRRTLEGVHDWQKIHRLHSNAEDKHTASYVQSEYRRYFAEALLLRLCESLGEHLVHSPEWLATVFQKNQSTFELTMPSEERACTIHYDIDYADLCEPLKEFCMNSNVFASKKQGINFDDINDRGLMTGGQPDLRAVATKTYREPIGLRVLFNNFVNYKWPLTIVLWMFSFALIVRESPGYERYAGRVASDGDERFTLYIVLVVDFFWLCVVNFCSLFVDTPLSFRSVRTRRCRFPRFWAFIALIVFIPLLVLSVAIELDWDLGGLLPSPVVSKIEDDEMVTTIRDMWYVPVAFIACRLAFGLLPKKNSCCIQSPFRENNRNKGRIAFFWLVFAIICFLTYYGVIIELVRPLTPKNLCQIGEADEDFCNTRQIALGIPGVPNVPFKDAQCVACMTSVASAWALSLLGCLLVPYFVFNCCVSLMGSSLGVARGLVETNIKVLDMSVHSLSSDFAYKRKSEASWLSHGTVLYAVYGKDWQRVWANMVDGLFDDCLIDSEVRSCLLAAARGGKKYDMTDVGANRLLPHAVQRIGYLFASHRSILSDPRISFNPYQGNDRDVHCDALGVTHPGRIPSLTQIIPVYSEEGIMDMKELLDQGVSQGAIASTLEFLVSQFPEEWRVFAESARERGLSDQPLHPTQLYEMLTTGKCTREQQNQVREWASHRAQSVIRTVNGALHYHRALQTLLRRGEGLSFDDLRRRTQLILAHQTYGKITLGKAAKATLRNGQLTFKDGHGLSVGDSVKLTLSAKRTLDFHSALGLAKVVDKFKERLSARRGTGDLDSVGTPTSQPSNATSSMTTPGTMSSREKPINIVFSLTIVSVDSAALLANQSVMEALVVSIKQAIVIEAADNLSNSEVSLAISAVDGRSDEIDSESAGGVSVECTIRPQHGGAFIKVVEELASSVSLRHTLAAAIADSKGMELVALPEGPARLGEVGAVSRRAMAAARSGSGFKNFRSGDFYTVEKVVDESTVVLAHTSASCGQVNVEKAGVPRRDQDLHYMLRKHKGFPFFVCIDFQRGKTHPRLGELIDEHVDSLSDGTGAHDGHKGRRFKYASVLLKYRYYRVGSKDERDDHWPVEVVHVLPRARGLLIGSEGNLSQGKSGNQLGALRFSEGHFLQMMDANMGCYSGEAFKVPIVLQGFYKTPTEKEKLNMEHRLLMRARIIGFREHIFTRSHGLVGKIMADAEWTFGTLVQRLLGFLNVRMHYGHPDFMDCFWANGRGSVSKASPHINLSEDIFAGLNVNARKERSVHTDILEWEKGREVQFCAGSGFFWKIASGSVGLMRTRDLRVLCGRASIMQSMALYFATIAWYVHNILVDYGTELYVLLFIFLTLASKSLSDIGALGSALAVEWFITPALSAILPAVIGFGVEYGPWWLFTQYLPTVPASMVYFIFINKSMASAVRATMWNNTAEYVNTGRPHANKSYTLLQAFIQFRASHYIPAVTLLYLVTTYALSNVGGALPMILIIITAICWIIAPAVFRPPTEGVLKQFTELAEFILRAPAYAEQLLPGKANSLYEIMLEQERKKAVRDPALQLLSALVLAALYLTIAATTIFEQMPVLLFAWGVTFSTKVIWRLSAAKRAGLLNLVHQLVLPVVLIAAGNFVENVRASTMLISLIVFVHFVETVKLLVWNISLLVLPRGSPLGYDRVVQITFEYGMAYQLQVYAAFAVLVGQAVTEGLLWVLDLPRLRLRTRALLNKDVRHNCVSKIFGQSSKDEEDGAETLEKKSSKKLI
jgi:hypothetical protein